MEWIIDFNKAIRYIEEHLLDELDYEEIAKIACCSSYYFQRMFSYMADIPLSEYIRRRRMSMAAIDLQNGKEKIIDLALKYGYTSPTAFNRAFQSVHGIPPSSAKEKGTALKLFSPISFKIIIKGASEMEYRIEKKEAFRIVGIGEPMQKEIEKNFEVVPRMWQKVAANGIIPKLVQIMDEELKGVLGVSVCNEKEDWRYFIAVASSKPAAEEFEEYLVPASTWAIFPGTGTMPDSIQELEKRIVTEWLPNSGYEYSNGPEIEVYLNQEPEHAQYEVWIPIKKKEN